MSDKNSKALLKIPSYFKKELEKNKTVKENFENLAPSHKREYVEWIMEAKQEETRQRRIKKAIEMIKEAKSMNEKYGKKQ